MVDHEKEVEARSMRMILSGILRMLGELSDFLPWDAETLPVLLKKVEEIAQQLKEAEDMAMQEREAMMEEMSRKLVEADPQ